MATAPSVSPRPSLSLLRSPPSSRTSLDYNSSQPPSLSRASTNQPNRRNRAALRDYYNLKSTAGEASSSRSSSVEPTQRNHAASPTGPAPAADSPLSALDTEGFDAGAYVRTLLESSSLKSLLRTENELVGEVRGLDGERKALVYDNYSKLISATDTIKKMRSNMDPLSPATSTLAPAISHIAESAKGLADELAGKGEDDGWVERERGVKSVRWVLEAEGRLRMLARDGRRDDMEREWDSVRLVLDKWKDVKGVAEVRTACERAVAQDDEV